MRAKRLKGVAIHHTGEISGQVPEDIPAYLRSMRRYHMETRGFNDIAYSFLVAPSGDLWQARGLSIRPAATGDWNDSHLAICVMGNFDVTGLSNPQRRGLTEGLMFVRFLNPDADDVLIHSDTKATACPGKHLRKFIQSEFQNGP